MKNRYVLRINCGQEKINMVSNILGTKVSSDIESYCDSYWEYITDQEENAVATFLRVKNLLDKEFSTTR